MIMENSKNLPIAIIGAGPVGLAAASHVMDRGMTPIIFEAGEEAGYAVRKWEHVRLFSPWKFNMDRAAVKLLENHDWQRPDPPLKLHDPSTKMARISPLEV